jgi:hypothetical protein
MVGKRQCAIAGAERICDRPASGGNARCGWCGGKRIRNNKENELSNQIYRSKRQVAASEIIRVEPGEMPVFSTPVCRGAAIFGSACGSCERCKYYAAHPEGPKTLIYFEGSAIPTSLNRGEMPGGNPPSIGDYYIFEDGSGFLMSKSEFEQKFEAI